MQFPLILSIVIHLVVVVLATFGLPFLSRDYEMVETPIIVELVEVAEITQAPSSARAKPEKPKAPEPPKEEPKPVPKEEPKPAPAPPPPPPPPVSPPPAPVPPPPEPPKAEPPPPAEAPKPAPPKEVAKVEEPKPPAPKPPAKPVPSKPEAKKEEPKPTPPKKQEPDAFASLLASVDAMKQEVSKEQPKAQQAAPRSNAGEASPILNAPVGEKATMSEIDAIRAQIERAWIINPGVKDLEGMVIKLRVRINPDGSVIEAEITDRMKAATDPHFRSMAESARRAAFNASPLKYPREKYDTFKVIELSFRPEGRL